MKKSTAGFIILLLVVLTTLSLITIFIATGLFDKYIVESPNISVVGENKDQYVEFPIQRGNIEVYANLKGTIVYSNGVINIPLGQSEASIISCRVGDEAVKEETILYTSGTNLYKSPVDGRILSIKDNNIQILDYNASGISVNIPSKFQSSINYKKTITTTFNDKSVDLLIDSISSTISQDTFEILLRNPFHALDGTAVDVHISFETKENVILVNKTCVHEDSDERIYLNIMGDDGVVIKTYVEIGIENETVVELKNADALDGKTAVLSKEESLLKGD